MREPKIKNARHSAHAVHLAEGEARELLNELLRKASNGERIEDRDLAPLKRALNRVHTHAQREETYPCSLCPGQVEARNVLVLAVGARFEKDANSNDVNHVNYGATNARNIIVCANCQEKHPNLKVI